MKKSSLVHLVAVILAILGAAAYVGALLGNEKLYSDATVLTLLSISGILCALFYLKQEKSS